MDIGNVKKFGHQKLLFVAGLGANLIAIRGGSIAHRMRRFAKPLATGYDEAATNLRTAKGL
jgi:hypothetical protein